jgi:hypothetical protein
MVADLLPFVILSVARRFAKRADCGESKDRYKANQSTMIQGVLSLDFSRPHVDGVA